MIGSRVRHISEQVRGVVRANSSAEEENQTDACGVQQQTPHTGDW